MRRRLISLGSVAFTPLLALVMVTCAPPTAAPAGTTTAIQSPAVASAFATSRPPSTTVPTADPGPKAIPDGYRIQIPRLGIDLPIWEGNVARDIDQQQTPENAAFHLPGTAIPGQHDNTYLYAHARRGMFLTLWNAQAGDVVYISTPDRQVLTYVIKDVYPRVAPADVSVAASTGSERLTLQTSTGPSPTDPRFVVLAFPKG